MPSKHAERELSDRLWERVRPLLPPPTARPKGGRPRADDRACFLGIVHVLRSGCQWQDLPAGFPSPLTCRRRHRDWAAAGVWERTWQRAVDELDRAGRVDTYELYPDATFVEARGGGAGRPDHVRQGDEAGAGGRPRGVPIGLATAAAGVTETALAGPALASIPPAVAVPAMVPVVADKGYDSDRLRDELAAPGFRLLAPHRKSRVSPSRNDGRRMRRYRRRWVVERTNAWVRSYRRVVVRHERYACLHLGFAHLACAFITLGRL